MKEFSDCERRQTNKQKNTKNVDSGQNDPEYRYATQEPAAKRPGRAKGHRFAPLPALCPPRVRQKQRRGKYDGFFMHQGELEVLGEDGATVADAARDEWEGVCGTRNATCYMLGCAV